MSQRMVKAWRILDADGRHVATHERWEPGPRGKSKEYKWRRPDGSYGLGGLPVARLPLYGCHEMPSDLGQPVVITEGQPACDALRLIGIPAVASVTGSAGCPSPEVLAVLAGRPVILWPDAKDGHEHMERIASELHGIAASVRVVVPPAEAPKGWDAADADEDTVRRLLAEAVVAGDKAPDTGSEIAAREGPLGLSDPEPWPKPVDTACVLGTTFKRRSRHTWSWPDEHSGVAATLWCAHTWVARDTADYSPRLHITGPTKECGKSRLLEVIGGLVRRPLEAASVTPAVMFPQHREGASHLAS